MQNIEKNIKMIMMMMIQILYNSNDKKKWMGLYKV